MLGFLFPFLPHLYHSASGLFDCVAKVFGMILSYHCQCENVSEDGEDKIM